MYVHVGSSEHTYMYIISMVRGQKRGPRILFVIHNYGNCIIDYARTAVAANPRAHEVFLIVLKRIF